MGLIKLNGTELSRLTRLWRGSIKQKEVEPPSQTLSKNSQQKTCPQSAITRNSASPRQIGHW
ncbi:hypothetical protein CAEBREN_05673 [Caenorhabditis brenneri]|uniref:Uncharacterized protein n=1 Tax=Caenorhabditis brenneri TaxID=135651 RepID=G0MUS2_CAEBE|nr:hypothetical protein CAEBREN_05673 [Caenorhabditis brenneri]